MKDENRETGNPFQTNDFAESDKVNVCMGISDERADELMEWMAATLTAFDKKPVYRWTEIMRDATAQCKTVNETAYVCYSITRAMLQNNSLHQMLGRG